MFTTPTAPSGQRLVDWVETMRHLLGAALQKRFARMAVYGVEIRNASNVQTLGMQDFTISRIGSMEIPSSGGQTTGSGTRSDYITWTIPGYDPANCFVLITPKVYLQDPQSGSGSYPMLPTYRNLGGSSVAIYTYVNRRRPTGVGNNYVDEWVANTVNCVLEAIRSSNG